ncbi:conserved hypothetical protein [Desulfamplus magnetovallimortis]|uniref:Xylose isomerase-like TIM barrel domain-containing protein n=1 Tax=Desulfamplus magnetovallimortis TaxID=1246637 RepID=A0A1W1HH62_9BACT|nr:cobamide remodeling phosphodiesterase CbiR [Desulfamplus magnetovallimortis]SLM31755.1 conserved hypothetical protein [Desulfamplus magnetovallimortis]
MGLNENLHTPLQSIKKTKLPFRLSTTSFIYPDKIIPNVIKLAPFFDEIELLFFESRPFILNGKAIDVLPSPVEIKELAELSMEFDITYNIHLPVDISMTDSSFALRRKASDTIRSVLELCALLSPTTHTLHLDFNSDSYAGRKKKCNYNDVNDQTVVRWREMAFASLSHLAKSLTDTSAISIETLDYPFEYLDGIIDACGMSVCVDAGHLIKYGYSIDAVFKKYRDKIPLVHLHGVDFSNREEAFSGILPDDTDYLPAPTNKFPKDHQALDKTPQNKIAETLNVLKEFTGVVSLEVFNYEDLSASLKYLGDLTEFSGF